MAEAAAANGRRVPMHHARARAPSSSGWGAQEVGGSPGARGVRGLPGTVGEKPPLWKQRAPGPDGVTLP